MIPEDDDHWVNFLILLDIVDYVFAPTTTSEKIAHVAVLVEDFLTEFSHLNDGPLLPMMSGRKRAKHHICEAIEKVCV